MIGFMGKFFFYLCDRYLPNFLQIKQLMGEYSVFFSIQVHVKKLLCLKIIKNNPNFRNKKKYLCLISYTKALLPDINKCTVSILFIQTATVLPKCMYNNNF